MVFRRKREIAKKTHGKKISGEVISIRETRYKRDRYNERKLRKKTQDDMTFMIKIEGPIQSTDMASIGMRKS